MKGRKKLIDAPVTDVEILLVNSRLDLFDHLTGEMKAIEERPALLADNNDSATLLIRGSSWQ